MRRRINLLLNNNVLWLLVILTGLLYFSFTTGALAVGLAQNPGVTSTPAGVSLEDAYVIVLDNEQGFANLRSGPGTLGYDIVGQMLVGQQAPALGRTLVGEWIMVSFPAAPGGVGWIYIDLVDLYGSPPIIEPPPTPTSLATATLDSTLIAQFSFETPPPRLPTFTPPSPLNVPTFQPELPGTPSDRIPIALLIIVLVSVGLIGFLASLFRRR